MPLQLGTSPAIQVLEVVLSTPWVGAWVAELDLALDSDQAMPSGKLPLTIGSTTLVGTVDPLGTGRMGEKARCRLVGGAGAWGTMLKAAHYHNDAPSGVSSAQVLAATAAEIGETVVEGAPVALGRDFVRIAGPAAVVLDGRDWYVDAKGITHVASWPTVTLGSDVDVLNYNPSERIAHIAADDPIWPGTVITDARFGTITVRDVDQRFNAAGGRVTVYHAATTTGRLNAALLAFAAQGAPALLRAYRYRIALQGVDGRVRLQAVSPTAGVPDTLPISVWPGMSGQSAKYLLGSQCAVVFLEADPTLPVVVAFDGSVPLEAYFDAQTLIRLGAGAVSPAAKAVQVDAINAAASTFSAAVNTFGLATGTIVASCLGPSAPQQATFAAAVTALTAAANAFAAAVVSTAALKVKVE